MSQVTAGVSVSDARINSDSDGSVKSNQLRVNLITGALPSVAAMQVHGSTGGRQAEANIPIAFFSRS